MNRFVCKHLPSFSRLDFGFGLGNSTKYKAPPVPPKELKQLNNNKKYKQFYETIRKETSQRRMKFLAIYNDPPTNTGLKLTIPRSMLHALLTEPTRCPLKRTI